MSNFKKPRVLLKNQTLIRGKLRVEHEPASGRYTARLALFDGGDQIASADWAKADDAPKLFDEEHEIDVARRRAWLLAIEQIAKSLGYDVKFQRRIEG